MQTPAEKIWVAAQEILKGISAETFNLWFAPLKAVEMDEDFLTLEVANGFSELWLRDNYLGVLQEVASKVSMRPLKVKFQVKPDGQKPLLLEAPKGRLPEVEEETDRTAKREFAFNPRNTFDTFVVGNNNTFAHAAALAVAQAPGKSYNPLFLYGGVGLGKTHLLHAIGQYVLSHKKAARVAYVSSEKFTNEYIDAIQNNQLVKFRKKYRQTDVLLIDDIQFLAGKERIQEEFFHTFNALHENHKQIVLTCDRPASELQNLLHRLVSHFEWGLVTDLQPPDVDMRQAI